MTLPLVVGLPELLVLVLIGLVLLVPAVLVIAAVVFGVRVFGGGEEGEEDPVETLKQRYARGEIDEEEFDRRMERLGDDDAPTASGEENADV